jgi:hypothetical protein
MSEITANAATVKTRAGSRWRFQPPVTRRPAASTVPGRLISDDEFARMEEAMVRAIYVSLTDRRGDLEGALHAGMAAVRPE